MFHFKRMGNIYIHINLHQTIHTSEVRPACLLFSADHFCDGDVFHHEEMHSCFPPVHPPWNTHRSVAAGRSRCGTRSLSDESSSLVPWAAEKHLPLKRDGPLPPKIWDQNVLDEKDCWSTIHGTGIFTDIYHTNHPNVGSPLDPTGRIMIHMSWSLFRMLDLSTAGMWSCWFPLRRAWRSRELKKRWPPSELTMSRVLNAVGKMIYIFSMVFFPFLQWWWYATKFPGKGIMVRLQKGTFFWRLAIRCSKHIWHPPNRHWSLAEL